MRVKNAIKLAAILLVAGAMFVFPEPVFAQATEEVSQVENFIRTIVQALATIAGLIAAGFLVVGGYMYITSSGDTNKLERAKDTIKYSLIGLVIVIAAFVIAAFVGDTARGSFGG